MNQDIIKDLFKDAEGGIIDGVLHSGALAYDLNEVCTIYNLRPFPKFVRTCRESFALLNLLPSFQLGCRTSSYYWQVSFVNMLISFNDNVNTCVLV